MLILFNGYFIFKNAYTRTIFNLPQCTHKHPPAPMIQDMQYTNFFPRRFVIGCMTKAINSPDKYITNGIKATYNASNDNDTSK